MSLLIPPRARVAAVALMILTSGWLAGCSGDQPPQPDPTTPPVAPTRTPSPIPSVSDAKGVQKDVSITVCDKTAGSVTASGTVLNTSKKSADFAITIAWLPDNSTDPVGVASTTVTAVEGKATADWKITTDLTAAADRCVINARRGSLS